MHKFKVILSLCIFGILLGITSFIKTQTRIVEKEIISLDRNIANIKNDLHETQLDYFYLTSPINLANRIKNLDLVDYTPMDFSRIYLNLKDFTKNQRKLTTLKSNNEKKKKKITN